MAGELGLLGGSSGVLLICTHGGGEVLDDLVACIGAFAVSDELETGLHRAFEHAELRVAFAKVSLSEGDRQEFEHFVEDMPKMAMIFSVFGEAAPLMHRGARLYAAQLLAALSLERGACHDQSMWHAPGGGRHSAHFLLARVCGRRLLDGHWG